MKRLALAVAISMLLAVLLLPPWRIAWTAAGTAPNPLPESWAGFHLWSYAAERPERVIAYDAPGGGGHVTLRGVPEVIGWLWGGLVLALAGVAYLLAGHRRVDN